MSIVQKAFVLSLASLALAIPQTHLERRQAPTTTPSPTFCGLGATSTAVSCLTRFTGLANSFCTNFAAQATSTTVITTNPTTTITVTAYSSTVFSSTDVITNASTITSTTTLTQTNNFTSGISTSFIPVEATSTITLYDYLCSATPSPVKRQASTLRPRPSCIAYLSAYRDQWGRNNACSCVRPNPSGTTTIVETSTAFTGTTVTRRTTVTGTGVHTSGVTTSTSRPITTLIVTSTELTNNTVPNITPVLTTTGTSYTIITRTTQTPIPTTFKLTVTLNGTTSYAHDTTVNAGTGLAFNSTSAQGRSFSINAQHQLVNQGLFLSVFTEATPNAIPFLFWQSSGQVADPADILSVDACNGTLLVPGAGAGEVFALCDGLGQQRLLALGPESAFQGSEDVCTVVEVRLDPASMVVGNGTATTASTTTSLSVGVVPRVAMATNVS